MSMKVLIAPDKFKGTLAASAAAEAIGRGWGKVRSQDDIAVLPISDGGEGFGEILGGLLGAQTQRTKTVNAAHLPCLAEWWWEPRSQTAIIEAARVNGLAMLPLGKYHPFELDTFGLGAVLEAALDRRARRCLVGIGGSATNDGGFGVARALGWSFISSKCVPIEKWTGLQTLEHFKVPTRTRWFTDVVVGVDVQNPLLGICGCSRVYGPQKGLRSRDFALAERCLATLAERAAQELHRDFTDVPGGGAAGGLGYGLRTFLDAQLEQGFDIFARYANLANRLANAQLVITGEGSIDAQTVMGKGVGRLASLCKTNGVPCLGMAGVIRGGAGVRSLFRKTYALAPDLTTKLRAIAEPVFWLERAAAQAAREWTATDPT
jgi:glycerate kinase